MAIGFLPYPGKVLHLTYYEYGMMFLFPLEIGIGYHTLPRNDYAKMVISEKESHGTFELLEGISRLNND